MANEIIEANYREVDGGRCLADIGAEIRTISTQMKSTVFVSIIEIGKRFEQAKDLVKHGEWGAWCERATGYSQSMAEKYIRAYHEYGDEQYTLFGDLSKSESITNLGVTKLLELVAVPADEREAFVEENNITDETTVRELKEKIKEYEGKIAESAVDFEKEKKELADRLAEKENEIQNQRENIKSLENELKNREAEKPVVSNDEMERFMAEADERAKEGIKKEIDKINADKDKAVADAEKLKKKLEKLNKQMEEMGESYKKIESSAAESEKRNEELKNEIERVRKESMLGSNEKLVRLNMCFETVQNEITALCNALEALREAEQYSRLKTVITETIQNQIDKMKG